MDFSQAILLGIIQGITEWLPVSSSGHLALAQQLMGLRVPVAFDIMLHLGTLLAVVIYYWRKLLAILLALIRLDSKSAEFRLALLILLGSIPTAIIGFALKDFFESMFSSPAMIGMALILTGFALFSTKFFRGKKRIGFADAFVVGVAQGIAVAPGISRSGWTISAGMARGVEKEKAADFSFLLSIPALIGAAIFEGRNAVFSDIDLVVVAAGVIVAAAVGYASIAVLLKLVRRGDFHLFAYYCWLLGLAAIALGTGIFKF